jgi:hypothetical protein
MSEETHNAAMSGPLGIIMAIGESLFPASCLCLTYILTPGVSTVLGWFLILGLLFSMQNYDATVSSTTGQPVTQIFLDTVGEKGAIVLMVLATLSAHDLRSHLPFRLSSSAPCSYVVHSLSPPTPG